MHVAIVHDTVTDADAPDARDVFAQADAVAEALEKLGHSSCRISCSLNLLAVEAELRRRRVDLVFNLVESIGGQGRLIHLLPFCLDAMAMPYTGARAEAMMLTSGKVMSKGWLASAGIPTPSWIGPWPGRDGCVHGSDAGGDTWIIKSVWEHASIGLDEQSIVRQSDPATVFSLLRSRAPLLGGACFAEQFIAGREFNLSVLGGPRGPEVLPPAEIIFEGYTDAMPRIVDYRAKWDEDAFEYHHTPRRFNFDATDTGLLERLEALALQCWHRFDLIGYARVDFRVDPAGNPWVLEINANPCLSPDAGFAAALEQAGIAYADAIGRIVDDGLPPDKAGTDR
ncbi:MAG: D-alanine--D-alanine ligase [Deltaproteobacteria bacterium]|nr:D-alanine--D-alanine ligase [Deltaproteobacteria bacterium]